MTYRKGKGRCPLLGARVSVQVEGQELRVQNKRVGECNASLHSDAVVAQEQHLERAAAAIAKRVGQRYRSSITDSVVIEIQHA